jgi:hypothetical protein
MNSGVWFSKISHPDITVASAPIRTHLVGLFMIPER